MKRLYYLLPFAVFAVLAIYFAVGLTKDPRRHETGLLVGQEVPPFDLPPIRGRGAKGFASSDLAGDVSLVNVFGSWCISCRVEHPFMMQLKAQGAVPIHGIDWREKDPDAGPLWLNRFGDPYTLVGNDPDSKAAIAFGVTGAPETFVVDRSGKIRYKHVGPITPEVWEGTLKPMIETLRSGS